MFFFEGKIELYTGLFIFAIPIGMSLLVMITKRKRLWIAPIAALIFGLVLTAIFYPYFFTDLISNNNDIGGGGYWLMFIVPAHCVVSMISFAICYVIRRNR